jgi:hypothetical protein
MAVANLNNPREEIITGKDNIVIVDVLETIRGGRTLDVAGYPKEVLDAGHVIIKETSTENFKPMPLNTAGNAYAELPTGHTYAGILIATILTKKPFAGIMVRGTVNHKAATFAIGSIMSAVQTALHRINFTED